MENIALLKALADETRLKLVRLLLTRHFCVRALARKLGISQAAVSQHLKVLREAGLLTGEKKGYFMHYGVNRERLRELAGMLNDLAALECRPCSPAHGGCGEGEGAKCYQQRDSVCHCGDEDEPANE